MKHINVTSLLLLILITLLSLSSCEHDMTSTTVSKQIDSLDQYVRIMEDNSSTRLEKLKASANYLDKAIKWDIDSLIFKGYVKKTFWLADSAMYDSAIYFSKQMLNKAILKNDTSHILKSYAKLSLYKGRQKDYHGALKHCQQLMYFASQSKDSLEIAKTHGKKGRYFKQINKYSEAFSQYNKAVIAYRDMDSLRLAGKTLHSMAKIQKSLGDYIGSKETAQDGVVYLEKSEEYKTLAGLYHIIAVANKEHNQLNEAERYNSKTLQLFEDALIAKKIGRTSYLNFKNTQANILAEQGQLDQAIAIFTKLSKDSLVIKSRKDYARVINNLGYVKWLKDKLNPISKKLLLEALDIRKQKNDISGLISSNTKLSEYFREINPDTSLQFAKESYKYAQQLNNPAEMLSSLDMVLELQINNLPNNYSQLIGEYISIRRNLEKTKNDNQNLYAATRFDFEKIEEESSQNKLSLAEQKVANQKLILVGTFTALALLLFLFRTRYKSKIARLEVRHRTEKRISKKIHDELGNDIFYLMTQIQNNPDFLHKNSLKILNGLQDIYAKARDISKEYSSIDTGDGFPEELLSLLNSYISNETKIITSTFEDGFWQSVANYKKTEVFRIAQELLINMKKHSQASFVAITFSKEKKKMTIQYADNGIGFSDPEVKLTSVENRIETLKGNLTFDPIQSKGCKLKIEFPI